MAPSLSNLLSFFVYRFTGTQPGGVTISGCPTEGVTATAQQAGATFAQVTWTEPTATDRSNQQIFNVIKSHQPGQFFQVDQTTQVTYTFIANSDDRATCTFPVTVTGKNACGLII